MYVPTQKVNNSLQQPSAAFTIARRCPSFAQFQRPITTTTMRTRGDARPGNDALCHMDLFPAGRLRCGIGRLESVVQVTKKYWRLWLSRISITQSSGNSSTGMIQPFRRSPSQRSVLAIISSSCLLLASSLTASARVCDSFRVFFSSFFSSFSACASSWALPFRPVISRRPLHHVATLVRRWHFIHRPASPSFLVSHHPPTSTPFVATRPLQQHSAALHCTARTSYTPLLLHGAPVCTTCLPSSYHPAVLPIPRHAGTPSSFNDISVSLASSASAEGFSSPQPPSLFLPKIVFTVTNRKISTRPSTLT